MKKLIFAMAVAAAGAAAAGVSFSYQGALRTAQGGPVTPLDKTIEFRLYDGPTTTDALWGRKIAVHLDDQGLFNVELSDTVGGDVDNVKTNNLDWVLADYLGKGRSLYIGLYVVGSTGEIRPRQRLLNVPAAAFAADVAEAKNDFTVNGIATIYGSVDAKDKMTVAKGLTVSSGGLTVSSGGLRVSSGDLTVPSGGLTVSGGGLKVSSGDLTVSGKLTASSFNIIPKGVIVMWSGAANAIPSGWALCNGSNGTPDLRNRFVVGAGSNYGVGATGGSDTVKLTKNQIPSHDHAFQAIFHIFETEKNKTTNDYDDYGYGVRWVGKRGTNSNAKNGGGTFDRPSVGTYTTSERDTDVKVSESGGSESVENRPPYYALCFIMKL